MKTRLIFSLLLTAGTSASALTLPAPDRAGDSLIGNPPYQVQYVAAKQEDTLIDIAVNFRLGQDEIVLANPSVDRWLPREGTKVRIPASFLLPDAPREGIVVNLPEMRIYYYPDAGKVITYAIGIGREDDWKTPLGKADIERINAWCIKSGIYHKGFNDHTPAELPHLLTQFEAVYQSYLKGINK